MKQITIKCTQGTRCFQLGIRVFISKYEHCACLLRTNQELPVDGEGKRVIYPTEDEHYSISTNRLRGSCWGIVCGCNLLLPGEYPGRHPLDVGME